MTAPRVWTAPELAAELLAVPPDTIVVLARDAEGTQFSGLAEVGTPDDRYCPDPAAPWQGTVAVDGDGQRCVVLWPTR